MLAGTSDAIARIMPSLNRIAKTIHKLGDEPGQAQAMKLVNNIMLAANMAVASEALAVGAKAGLDADVMADVIRSSTGQSAAADILARFALPKTDIVEVSDRLSKLPQASYRCVLLIIRMNTHGFSTWRRPFERARLGLPLP